MPISFFKRKAPRLAALTFAFDFLLRLSAADQPVLNEHLEILRPLLGKTWRGEFKNSTPEKPVVDIARWERRSPFNLEERGDGGDVLPRASYGSQGTGTKR